MSTNSNTDTRPESFPRVILCRLFSFAAVLSLWHIPDWAAAVIYSIGVVPYYVPYPAASSCPAPDWLRPAWFGVGAIMVAAYIFLPSPPPTGSVIPPAFKYGGLALLAVQVAFDIYRRKRFNELDRNAYALQRTVSKQ